MALSNVARTCLELVATPSEYGDETLIADLVQGRIASIGVRHQRLGNAIVARIGGEGDAVALVGHLDTVPNWEGGEAHVDGGRIVGRGSADMKGGDAVMLALLETRLTAPQPVVFLFYDREEGPNQNNGIHAVLRDATLIGDVSFAVVLEPTSNTVHAGAVGTLNADVVYSGRLAHSARPWEGSNAITNAAAALKRFAARTEQPIDVDGLRFHDTISITMAHAGTARNVVPDRFALAVNVRVAPGRSLDEARREVEALAGDGCVVTWLDESPPAPPGTAHPAVRRFIDTTGVAVHPKQAWTDVATLHHAGIPAINFGPGDSSQAHQRGEYVTIAALETCQALLGRYLESR
jgi:succinyl-diaminopimelate desuccinylase